VFVYLDQVDPRKSHAWTLPPVAVEARKTGLTVKQNEQSKRMGIVRRGEPVALVSGEQTGPSNLFHSIRGRGADFFTQMLPVPNQPVHRVLPDAGIVELTSASGYYWLRAYLLVIDHPYAAISAADGTVALDQVPEGNYELVCWVPNWHIERVESDPEWAAPVRMYFRSAVEKRQKFHVKAGEAVDLKNNFAGADFGRDK
jgi:hypothetical protein